MLNGGAPRSPATANKNRYSSKKERYLSSCYVSLKHGEALPLERGPRGGRADVLQEIHRKGAL